MSDDPLIWILIAAVFAIPALIGLARRPRRLRDRDRDLAEDAARSSLCRRRGWTFRRDDGRHAEDRLRIWAVGGSFGSGNDWTVTFRQGSDLASDTELRLHADFVCEGYARSAPLFVFGRQPMLESLRDGWLRGLTAAGVAAQAFLGNARRSFDFHGASGIAPVARPAGYAWAAREDGLAAALARDARLCDALGRLIPDALGDRGAPSNSTLAHFGIHLALDERGLTCVLRTDFLSAPALEALVDAAARAAELADERPAGRPHSGAA